VKITVSCIGGSAQYIPGGGQKVAVTAEAGDTVESVLARLGVSADLFMFALANGEKVDLRYAVREGDDVVLVSPLMGG
jgi:sulfur carrier protein ThiS